ncbi:MAG: aminopeptidase P family protein [Ruminococcaceae bacterium]|nr:aminopeptidase P family protein [Oscillospiraceae bacterium]
MTRTDAFLQKLNELGADSALLRKPASLLYISGFTGGEGTAVLSAKRRCLLVDSRYTLQAKAESPEFEILPHDTPLSEILETASTVAYEGNHLSVSAFSRLKESVPGKEWTDLDDTLLMLRKSKDFGELSAITEAVKLADDAFSYTVARIRPGMQEFEVAALLEGYMRSEAGATPSFETICASGWRSALPHGAASDKVLQRGDFLTMDFGCLLNGYCSDITRTVCIGPASDRQKEIYNIVLYAQSLAENAARGGIKAAELDSVARRSIEGFGYGDYFGHALGHGVGLEIHEYPTVSPRSAHEVAAGDVFTVEPGIYVPDFGGVRIEDMLYATPDGYAVLTKTPKTLLEIL